ncbi:hypothetical protein MPTK1_6g04240 [Marchantia polymorpha subsp. ruderalis]|uniref:Uncharacterized protein n=2 Tax=Marchantia polymorpha TaxID=3197 RepID=A0AAF6BNE2_MARPO|nr:hypothetical protein MARPO_0034s0096 [Marchantia polymorpha]BBN13526.1 hypothetical protein Mp_6g04240 [Marchantia polymorpha subsp. ruderalis]|eukprot:PTQ41514.1 hypothetical protein MARPO_0034s0096 [Marchantia polymorpha]
MGPTAAREMSRVALPVNTSQSHHNAEHSLTRKYASSSLSPQGRGGGREAWAWAWLTLDDRFVVVRRTRLAFEPTIAHPQRRKRGRTRGVKERVKRF